MHSSPHTFFHRTALRGVVAVAVLLGILSPGLALAQDDTSGSTNPRAFDTGYQVDDDAIWTFFSQYGGASTFGEPISREVRLLGAPVQIFQNAALQVQPDGSVRVMQLTDPGLLAYSSIGGLTFPAANPSLATVAPTPDQPNYTAGIVEFLRATVPDTFNGRPVDFFTTLTNTVSCDAAFPDQPCQTDVLNIMDLDVWGLPTSSPAADPANPSFVYQRFQNGIMMYNAADGTTHGLPFGQYLAELLTGQSLPADLQAEAAGSPLLSQYAPGQPNAIARPTDLTNSDLTNAFVPNAS